MYLGIIVEIKSPTIYFMVWMIPVVFFTTPVAKEGIKASVCGKVLWFEETQMPLKDKSKAYTTMLNHADIKPNHYFKNFKTVLRKYVHWLSLKIVFL